MGPCFRRDDIGWALTVALRPLLRSSRLEILRVNEALGGISRLTFQMGVSTLPHPKMMRAIELLGTQLAPMVRKALAPAAV